MKEERMTLNKLAELLTRAFDEFREEYKAEFAEFKDEIKEEIKGVKEDIGIVRRDMEHGFKGMDHKFDLLLEDHVMTKETVADHEIRINKLEKKKAAA